MPHVRRSLHRPRAIKRQTNVSRLARETQQSQATRSGHALVPPGRNIHCSPSNCRQPIGSSPIRFEPTFHGQFQALYDPGRAVF